MVLGKTFVILKKISYNGFMHQPFLEITRMITIIDYPSRCNKSHRPRRNSPKLKTQKIKDPKTSQLTSQPTSQPTDQPPSQPPNQPACRPTATQWPFGWSTLQPGFHGRTDHNPTSHRDSQPARQLGSQPANQKASQPASQSASQSVKHAGQQKKKLPEFCPLRTLNKTVFGAIRPSFLLYNGEFFAP